MREIRTLKAIGVIYICRTCQFSWMERGGFERCPQPTPSLHAPLPAAAAREFALAEIHEQELKAHQGGTYQPPDEWWQVALAVVGMPVKIDAPSLAVRPWATWSIAAVMAAVTLAAMPWLGHAVSSLGFMPAHPWRDGGLTLITGFFLHLGFIHLLSNAYFLLVFGDNVEDVLGWKRYLVLLAAAALGGDLTHGLIDPHSTVPCVGASGGISGIIAFYACAFPRTKLAICVRFFFWWRIPAWGAFVLWIAIQVFGAVEQVFGLTDVSSLAHLGGSAVGIMWWLFWRRRNSSRLNA
jgi:membrane associated rhomboid family serine protease